MTCTLRGLFLIFLLIPVATAAATAQEQVASAKTSVESAGAAGDEKKDMTATASPTADDVEPTKGKISRWLEIQTATLSSRYVYRDNSDRRTTANQVQHGESFKGRFKFDPKGNYSIVAGLSTGDQIVQSWNDTGIGGGRGSLKLYLKHLYFSARPVEWLELQTGSIYALGGESTEITGLSEDAYLMGQRVSLYRPKDLFFDEISVIYGFLGDYTQPGIGNRFHRLKKFNYHQFLVSKKVGSSAVFSADYAFLDGVETLTEAVRINTQRLKLIDSLRFENYQRLDVSPGYGFAVSGEKSLWDRVVIGGGFAQIDPQEGSLNSDAFSNGKRLFASSTFIINQEFSISTLATRSVANSFAVPIRTHFHIAFHYNLLRRLRRTGIF